MKKFLSLLAVAFVLVACDTDDDSNESEATIVGTFVLTDFNSIFNDDFNGDGTVSDNLLDEIPCLENTITFNQDLTYTSVATSIEIDVETNTAGCEGPFTSSGTYTLNGNQLEITELETNDPDDIAFSASSGEVTITSQGITITNNDFGPSTFVYERQ